MLEREDHLQASSWVGDSPDWEHRSQVLSAGSTKSGLCPREKVGSMFRIVFLRGLELVR